MFCFTVMVAVSCGQGLIETYYIKLYRPRCKCEITGSQQVGVYFKKLIPYSACLKQW